MAPQSRLDAALNDAQRGGEWYRSPLALVAGAILFIGALALVVLAVTGGDDTAAPEDATSAAPAANGEGVGEGGADQAGAPSASVPSIGFGGDGIPEVDQVVLAGDPLVPLVPGEPDAAVGTLAPQITATSLASGGPITLGPGRARVIGFFAHWCPHCQAELPEVTAWLAENRLPPNTEFIAVSTAVDQGNGNYPPSAWFNDVGFNAPVLVDDADATFLNGMGFSGFPAFVAIDASGVVVARAGGNIGTEGLAELFSNFASASS